MIPQARLSLSISRFALAHNLDATRRRLASGTRLLAVVKADAYGHGLVECARVFQRAGADALGVASVEEGAVLRAAGVDGPVVVLIGLLPDEVEAAVEHGLECVVVDPAVLEPLALAAARAGRRARVHLKLDLGMGRAGVLPLESEALLRRIREMHSLELAGLMAHLPFGDHPDGGPAGGNTAEICALFREFAADVAGKLPPGVVFHLANSGGVFLAPESHLDMVRPGIALYGGGPGDPAALGLRQAMRLACRIIQVRRVPAGTGLGYDHTWTTTRTTTLALLPVGYGDCYSRRLSNRAQVLVRGERVPVVGRVSMNLVLADVTAVPGVAPGDEAVLLGEQHGETITAHDLAAWMDTISYEVFCLLGRATVREYGP